MNENFCNNHIKAILVGVADYSAYAGTCDLPLSVRDVTLMEYALVRGLRINPFNIWIRNAEKGVVTRKMFLRGIRIFLQDIDPDDVLIFYFSGHGSVIRGKHYMMFSDGPLETQSVIDVFSELHVSKRILFLDCCMSGRYELRDIRSFSDVENANSEYQSEEPERISGDSLSSVSGSEDGTSYSRSETHNYSWIDQILDGGTAVFASSRPEERSGYSTEIPASLFTTFLWNAMTNRFYVRDGCITLDRIRDLVYADAAAWNEWHPDRAQHPVFRSSMAGTVAFRVIDAPLYRQKQYAVDRGDYVITEVKPLHSQIAKRYAVKVILKHAVTETELIRINGEIVRAVRSLDIYKNEKEERRWKGRPATLVFTYYGYSPEDIAQGLHAFYTTWADECEDRTHWYRTNAHSKVAGGILINTNPSYGWLRKLSEEYSADSRTVAAETKKLMLRVIDLGETTICHYQEFINGMLSKEELLERVRGIQREADRLYIAMSDLPIPPPELAKWSLLATEAAGDIQDFSYALHENAMRDIDAEQMDETINRFHRDLERLREEEKQLSAAHRS